MVLGRQTIKQDKTYFNRTEALERNPPLGAGRPFSEYNEPWSSGFNFAFFQTSEFKPMTSYSWEIALLPICLGLTASNKGDLVKVVKEKIAATLSLGSFAEVTMMPHHRLLP
jgi:hypothetical protein